MPVYNAPLQRVDAKETRRYAGLMKAKGFDEALIEEACEDALLLAVPKGVWQVYDYDCELREVKSDPPCILRGEKIGKHLAGCDKVILLSATVGEDIEETVTKRFQRGEYASSVLLDAAATTAVEQIADEMEKAIRPKAAAKGYRMRWRFSPGYGDWPMEQQPGQGGGYNRGGQGNYNRGGQGGGGNYTPRPNSNGEFQSSRGLPTDDDMFE